MNERLPGPPSPSLLAGARAALPHLRSDRRFRLALAIAALLAAGPLLTIAGARYLEDRVRGQIARAEPRDAGRNARDEVERLISRPGVGATIETLARVLPEEARLVRVERDAAGAIGIEVAAPDPDRVRDALRADADTRSLRDAGQRGGEGAMIVAFNGRP